MVRKAQLKDAEAIHRLIEPYAEQGRLLPVSLAEVYERLRDFWVFVEGDEVLACGALRIVWEDLAEVRSLAVKEVETRRGIGTEVVTCCIEEARQYGIPRLFVLTYQPEFFLKLGFKPIAKEKLPHKIWLDCVKCAKFPNCDEQALLLEVG